MNYTKGREGVVFASQKFWLPSWSNAEVKRKLTGSWEGMIINIIFDWLNLKAWTLLDAQYQRKLIVLPSCEIKTTLTNLGNFLV